VGFLLAVFCPGGTGRPSPPSTSRRARETGRAGMAAVAGGSPGQGADAMQPDPQLDLSNPRVRSAMRELGIRPEELVVQDPASPGSTATAPADFAARSVLKERKRRELRQRVADLANRQEKQRYLASQTSGLDRELKAHAEQMERMQRTARQVTQGLLVKELERKLQVQGGDKKLQESAERSQMFAKEVEERRKAERKLAQAKQQKMQEAIEKGRLQEEEARAEQRAKLIEALEQNEVRRQEREVERQQSSPVWNYHRALELKQEREERIAMEEERRTREQDLKWQRFEQKHRETALRTQEEIEKKRRAAQEKSANSAEKFWQHQERQKGDVAAEESRRREVQEKLERAQAKREAMVTEVKKACAAKNIKVQSAHAKVYEAVVAQQEQQAREMEEAFLKKVSERGPRPPSGGQSPGASAGPGVLSRSFSNGFTMETVRRREEHRLVAEENKQRLARQELFSQQKQRAKFDQMLRRNQMIQDKRRQAMRLRQDLQKNCITERDNLEFEFNRAKSSPPSRMIPLVEKLRPEAHLAKQIDGAFRKLGVERPGASAEEEDEK